MSCKKDFFKVVIILMAIISIAVGWFHFYNILIKADFIRKELLNSTRYADVAKYCDNPDIYWQLYIIFESVGTILTFVEIYYVILEMKEDKHIECKCFGKTFILILLLYLTAAFPSAILEILHQDLCICKGTFSLDTTIWRDDVRVIARNFLVGISVIMFQVLLHLTLLYRGIRRIGMLLTWLIRQKSYTCCEEQGCDECNNHTGCFAISLSLAIGYTAVFITGTVFMFCKTS